MNRQITLICSRHKYISHCRGKSCLDHVFSNSTTLDVSCKLLDKRITDHAMIDITVEFPCDYLVSEGRRIQFTNEKKFLAELKSRDWDWVEKAGKKIIILQ